MMPIALSFMWGKENKLLKKRKWELTQDRQSQDPGGLVPWKGKLFKAPFKFSWFLGFLFHSDLGYGPVVSTWGALRYSFNLGGVWNIRQQAGFLSRRCGYSFFTSCFPCFSLRHGFVNICLSQLFKSGLEWCMIFLEQALGIIKEATWSYCIVFCHFQSTDLTLVG